MFYTRLEELCHKNGTSVAEVAEKVLCVSSGTPTGWKKGASPKASVVVTAAKYFNVSADYLLGIIDTPIPLNDSLISLSDVERLLITQLRCANPLIRDNVYSMANSVLSTSHDKAYFFNDIDESSHHNPAFSEKRSQGKAAAGVPIEAVPEDDDAPVVRVPLRYTGSNYFVIEAQGDSMIGADIHSGDFCVFQADAHHDNGRIVLAQITDSSTDQYTETIKRLYVLPDKVELRSENPAYPPLFYPRDEVQIAGVLVYISSANNAH